MKLTAKTDLDVPAAFVYDLLSDHAGWAEEARRRGAEAEADGSRPPAGVGAAWRVRFPFRGKIRKVTVRVEDMQTDRLLTYSFEGNAIEGGATVEITALSARRSRLRVGTTVKPRTLAARLLLNTLRLARRRVQARYDKRMTQLAGYIQTRYAQSRAGGPAA